MEYVMDNGSIFKTSGVDVATKPGHGVGFVWDIGHIKWQKKLPIKLSNLKRKAKLYRVKKPRSLIIKGRQGYEQVADNTRRPKVGYV